MTERWDHIPIVYIDVRGFTTYNADTQALIVRRLQDMATEAARAFIPEGEVWSTWRRHGTGDGYYFLLIGAAPPEALAYAFRLNDLLAAHNAQHGVALPLRLYGALDLGAVTLIEDQYHSEAFARAARFLSYQPFKDYAGQQAQPLALAMTVLFHTEWRAAVQYHERVPAPMNGPWTPFTFRDKHGYEHRGLVHGAGWEPPAARPAPPRTLGEVKLDFCHRLGADWQDLADHVGMQAHEKARFSQGNEPRGVWEWLEARRRLGALPDAVRAIGRVDLLEGLPHPS